MTSSLPVSPVAPDLHGKPQQRWWLTALSLVLSVAMLVVVWEELDSLDWPLLQAMLPTHALFWIGFAGFYLAGPAGDWLAFRRLWGIAPAAITALIRKQVYNDILLGYMGEAYLYTWAKARGIASPFGAVKDVAILSALVNNLFTVALLVVLWPRVSGPILASGRNELLWSLMIVLGLSLVLLVAQRRVFSLAARDRWMVSAIHLGRIAVNTTLAGMIWHLVLPEVSLVWWLYLATVRQLVSRLPLIANKDLLFAGLAVLLLGDQPQIADTMALTAVLLVATNVTLGLVFVACDMRGWVARRWVGKNRAD